LRPPGPRRQPRPRDRRVRRAEGRRGRPGRRPGDRPVDGRRVRWVGGKKKPHRPELTGDQRFHGFADYHGPIRVDTDYLIVGSGPGGPALAYQLAAQGARVTVVEAGPRVTKEEFPGDMGRTLSRYFW